MSNDGMGKFRVLKDLVSVIGQSGPQVQCSHYSWTNRNGANIGHRCDLVARVCVNYIVSPRHLCVMHAVQHGVIEPVEGSHDEP